MESRYSAIIFTLIFGSISASAWSNHGLSTYIALKNTEISQAKKVKAESLEEFIDQTGPKLKVALESIDQEIKTLRLPFTNTPQVFTGTLKSFLHALRINSQISYGLYLQDIPNLDMTQRKRIDFKQVSLIKNVTLINRHFLSVKDHEEIPPLWVVVTHSDEPDFGMDIGLFEDIEGSTDGEIYGFGKIPFGNPRLEYATQAPFHMGFFFESWLTYTFKPEIKRTFSLARVYQFRALSQFAFKEGHPYWGYRFAAWALHYIQDLAQPYHSSLVPGASDTKKVLAILLNMISLPKMQNDMINEITNLHIAVEEYQFHHLAAALKANYENDVLVRALEKSAVSSTSLVRFDQIKDLVAKTAYLQAPKLQEALGKVVAPQIYLSNDPGNIDYFSLIHSLPEEQKKPLEQELSVLMQSLGQYTRDFISNIHVQNH